MTTTIIEDFLGHELTAWKLYDAEGRCLVCGSLNPFEHDDPCESPDGTILLDPRDLVASREDAERDFADWDSRVINPGTCTCCEMTAAELLPWTPAEKLCWRCVDLQLDLLAKAVSEGNAQAVNVMKARWA